jgi:hypothetical protein
MVVVVVVHEIAKGEDRSRIIAGIMAAWQKYVVVHVGRNLASMLRRREILCCWLRDCLAMAA